MIMFVRKLITNRVFWRSKIPRSFTGVTPSSKSGEAHRINHAGFLGDIAPVMRPFCFSFLNRSTCNPSRLTETIELAKVVSASALFRKS
jgi:hypothetical protein